MNLMFYDRLQGSRLGQYKARWIVILCSLPKLTFTGKEWDSSKGTKIIFFLYPAESAVQTNSWEMWKYRVLRASRSSGLSSCPLVLRPCDSSVVQRYLLNRSAVLSTKNCTYKRASTFWTIIQAILSSWYYLCRKHNSHSCNPVDGDTTYCHVS